MLVVISVALVAATIIVPLRQTPREIGWPLAAGGTVYFALIGIGFMMIEIALLQRMSVFLGHPIYALSIVLFSLILWTGLGSVASERAIKQSRPRDGAAIIIRPTRLLRISAILSATSWPTKAPGRPLTGA